MEKVSLVITVLNEANTICALLNSIEAQTRKPDEVVIVDGGSADATFTLLRRWKPRFPVKILQKRGNRSVGRNLGIRSAKHPLIAITDAGCVLEPSWHEEICKPFAKKRVDVVSGHYRSEAPTPFAKAASAYMLVMPNHVNETNFLPATRSMAIRRTMWERVGGFPEDYTYNEDYVFAHAMKKIGASIHFARNAIVVWNPPTTWKPFLTQVWKFAYGDVHAGILRPKVTLIFLRYAVFFGLFTFFPLVFVLVLILYAIWAMQKNYPYIDDPSGLYLLPMMQFSTDIAVMMGSLEGFMDRLFV